MLKKKMKIETGIVYADAHYPSQDKKSCKIVHDVIADMQPDFITNLGDGADIDSFNFFLIRKPRLKEGVRIVKELNGMYSLDDYITEKAPKKCEKTRHVGNHEQRIFATIDARPELEGLRELDFEARYREMGWSVIPWGEFSNRGKLYFHHGDRKGYQGMWHAKQWATCGKSVMYGHRHDAQRFTTETMSGKQLSRFVPNAAISVPCLGTRTPQWMDNRRNNWSNGFGVVYLRPNGDFNAYIVDIIDGKCVWNGKLYEG